MSTGRTYFTIKQESAGWMARLWDENTNLIWWTEHYVHKAGAEAAVRAAMATNFDTPVYYR